MDAPIKLVAAEVPTRRIVPPRRASGTAFALPLLAPRANAASPGRALRTHPLRAVAIVPTAATLFVALAHLAPAAALARSSTAPILTALLARGARPGRAAGPGFLGVPVVPPGELGRGFGRDPAGRRRCRGGRRPDRVVAALLATRTPRVPDGEG